MNAKKPNQSHQPKQRDPERLENSDISEVRQRIEKSIGPLINKGQKDQVIERVSSIIAEENYAGPIPHPRHIQQYEDACPGAADRLIAMAEKVNDAQISGTENLYNAEINDQRRGQYLGFAALVVIIIACVVLALNDKPIMSASVLGLGAAGVIARFVNGRQS